MKKCGFALALVCLSMACFADLRSDINSMNKKVVAAMMKKDFVAFKSIVKDGVTSDFKYSENGQTMNFDQMVEMVKQGFSMMEKMEKASSKLISLKVTGKTATGKTHHVSIGTTKGQDGKLHRMSFSGTSSDTYVNDHGKWKMSSMTWISQKMAMDGKPFDPSKMGPPNSGK